MYKRDQLEQYHRFRASGRHKESYNVSKFNYLELTYTLHLFSTNAISKGILKLTDSSKLTKRDKMQFGFTRLDSVPLARPFALIKDPIPPTLKQPIYFYLDFVQWQNTMKSKNTRQNMPLTPNSLLDKQQSINSTSSVEVETSKKKFIPLEK